MNRYALAISALLFAAVTSATVNIDVTAQTAAHKVGTIRRRQRVGGLLNYYERAA